MGPMSMVTAPDDPPDTTLPDMRGWWSRVRRRATAQARQTLIFAGVGFGVAYALNVWVMAGFYDGYRTPAGVPATGHGNFLMGTVFYLLASTIISSLISYRIAVGPERFGREIRAIPEDVRRAVTDDAGRTSVHMLMGFGLAVMLAAVTGPSVSAILAVAAILAFLPIVRPVASVLISTGFRRVIRRLIPAAPQPPAVGILVGIVGSAGGFAFGWLIPTSLLAALVIGAAAIVAAYVLAGQPGRANPQPPAGPSPAGSSTGDTPDAGSSTGDTPGGGIAAVLLFAGLGAFAALHGLAGVVFADDGGFTECANPGLLAWLTACRGSATVLTASLLGASAAGLGSGLGSAIGSDPGGSPLDKPWSEMTPEEREEFRQGYIRRWKATHPNHTSDQLQRFIEGLDARDPSWWESTWDGFKNFANAYGQDLASGKQLEGLDAFFEAFKDQFLGAGADALNELKQLPGTLRELPGVLWDDLASGGAEGRLEGMLEYGGEAIKTAADFYSDPDKMKAAIEKYGPEAVEDFLHKIKDLERAINNEDPTAIRKKIGEVAGELEFMVGSTALGDKGLSYLADLKAARNMDGMLDTMRATSKSIEVPSITDDLLLRRQTLLDRAAAEGRVKLTNDEAAELFAIDRKITLERQGTILQHGEGSADSGAFSVYKLSDDAESSLTAMQLRTEHPELYTGKWNPVPDKGFKAGEEAFMSADDLAKLNENPIRPGETVNYKPRELAPAEYDALSPDMQARYNARVKDAAGWDNNLGFENRRTVDYSKPGTTDRYGEMWVPEDTSGPVKAAEFWKDPVDNKLYVRYQTADGTWHPPKLQASDVDTVTHGGGTRLTYEQSREMQYQQAMGQLGEGDTAQWGMSMLEKGADGSYVIADPANKDMVVKAINSLVKAEKEMVITQDLDGLYLEQAKFPELEHLKDAARALDAQGGWDAATRDVLHGMGVL